MIYNSSSVVFICITFIFYYYTNICATSNFLIISDNNIVKCSDHEYLIINNWSDFAPSLTSCPNQPEFFNRSTVIYNYGGDSYKCDANTNIFLVEIYASIFSFKKEKIKMSDTDRDRLSSTMYFNNRHYPFKATSIKNGYMALVNQISVNCSSKMLYNFYITFTEHSTICRIKLTCTKKNKSCKESTVSKNIICYSEPFSKIPLENIDWEQLDTYVTNDIYGTPGWEQYGGYLLDLYSFTTTSTLVSCEMFSLYTYF